MSVYTCQDDKVFVLYIADSFAKDVNSGIVRVMVASSLFSYLPSLFHSSFLPSPRTSTTCLSATANPPFHGSMNRPVGSVSLAEPGVSTTEVSSVLSSSSIASSLEKEDRDRLLPRAELDADACRLRGGGFSAGSLCSKTDSVKPGDADSDPRLAKAAGGMRRRKVCRVGEECGVEPECSFGVRIGDVEDKLERLCPRRSLAGIPKRAAAAGRDPRLARMEGGMGAWTGRVGKCASEPRRRALS